MGRDSLSSGLFFVGASRVARGGQGTGVSGRLPRPPESGWMALLPGAVAGQTTGGRMGYECREANPMMMR
ncbi:MAG: hypothetical protein HQM02_13760 [Magnetococcales bacterium]|nr:hypothetical protein [Magnetococcales bacterium]